MKALVLALAILAVLAVAFVVLKRRASSAAGDSPWPFYAKKPLTQPEQVLYHRLVAAMPECIVLAQVQLSQVLGVKKGFNFHEWNNRINRMSLDFLVCLKDLTVVAAVELDDKTHERASRVEADAKKERALSAAGIALVRWNVSALPDENTIRQALATTTSFIESSNLTSGVRRGPETESLAKTPRTQRRTQSGQDPGILPVLLGDLCVRHRVLVFAGQAKFPESARQLTAPTLRSRGRCAIYPRSAPELQRWAERLKGS